MEHPGIMRDPTLHFFLVLLGSPICAIIGVSLDQPSNQVSTSLVGWLVTLVLCSVFGIRSVIHQWNALPCSPTKQWPDLSQALGIRLRLLIGVGLIALVSAMATVLLFGLLAVQIIQTFLH
ncbi:MAG: hypothetical protein RMJ55_02915 [Roseiflexaceae bacterium]|nr:hypothetical protein [Roseiflexus sp.]MDW8212483.1 hypothetical protein [Roseiflexaceae bacterium]